MGVQRQLLRAARDRETGKWWLKTVAGSWADGLDIPDHGPYDKRDEADADKRGLERHLREQRSYYDGLRRNANKASAAARKFLEERHGSQAEVDTAVQSPAD